MVSDRDIARKVNEVTGSALDDVYEAWDRVRGRLDSRDDSETARAFKAVLDRYRASLAPTGGDGEAEALYNEIAPEIFLGHDGMPESVKAKIAAALQAARARELELHKAGCDAYEIMEAKVKALKAAGLEAKNLLAESKCEIETTHYPRPFGRDRLEEAEEILAAALAAEERSEEPEPETIIVCDGCGKPMNAVGDIHEVLNDTADRFPEYCGRGIEVPADIFDDTNRAALDAAQEEEK